MNNEEKTSNSVKVYPENGITSNKKKDINIVESCCRIVALGFISVLLFFNGYITQELVIPKHIKLTNIERIGIAIGIGSGEVAILLCIMCICVKVCDSCDKKQPVDDFELDFI